MARPFRIGNTYYFRLHVPRDVVETARGRRIFITVGESIRSVKVGNAVKVSLRTSDAKEAKARFALAQADAERFWCALREGPKRLTHKESLALAGEICAVFIDAFDEEPGIPKTWERVIEINKAALAGRMNPLHIGTQATRWNDLEQRFGPFLDAVAGQKGLVPDNASRVQLLQNIAHALSEAAEVNLKKAQGDYSMPQGSGRYPTYETPASARVQREPLSQVTFNCVIDAEVALRAAGRDAKPLPGGTERKFRMAADEFTAFRASDIIGTVTAEEFDAWRDAMTAEARIGNNTIKQKMQNVSTVVKWAREGSFRNLFPNGNPLADVRLPEVSEVSSESRTFRLAEARQVLIMARNESSPEKRWLPWLCAYSGARINEVAQLRQSDFFQVEGEWFYRLTTAGGRKLKNLNSERRVPVHPDLIDEGLITFIMKDEHKQVDRIFPVRSQGNVASWVRNTVGITRKELAPSHGWRHLFEDLCVVHGVLDKARNYITGRVTGDSGSGYGRSDALLPGLAEQMRKIGSYL